MQFYEKLSFLLDLTSTSNRVLAQAIHVDPSLISRLRTGKRNLPQNQKYTKPMALYFARHCTTDYQHQALFEMLAVKQVSILNTEHLSDIIYYWLCGETDEVSRFMRTFGRLNLEETYTGIEKSDDHINTGNSVYYGNEGKRAAARAAYQHLQSLEKPGLIFIFTDENDTWISQDYEFSCTLQKWGLDLIHRGFKFCHIAPPVTLINEAFESLTRWMPLYMTGQTTVYFYPRLRDTVHRRTIVVMPQEIALTSSSIYHQRSGNVTLLTTDRQLTQAYAEEFHDYLSLCRPMLESYTNPEKLTQCFTQFLSADGIRIQQVPCLSAETTPAEILNDCLLKRKETEFPALSRLYMQEKEKLAQKKEDYSLIDITCLSTAEEVRQGKVPISFSYGLIAEPLYYTPETYILHLQNILKLMETCSNYHFVPLRSKSDANGPLMVKEGQRAILVHLAPPLTAFEISQPDIVQLCREHLLQIADRIGYTGICRVKIMSQIKELIRELQH